MKRNLPLLVLSLLFTVFYSKAFSQDYSVRSNLLNLIAKGPSVTFGKNIKEHAEVLLTYSEGGFSPFLTVDSYKYKTIHSEYRWKDIHYSKWQSYYGGYLRYIHKRIFAAGYDAGPYGIFSKAERNFIGDGISIGLTSGVEYSISNRWLLDSNILFGAGKYLSQKDYAAHDKIPMFLDTRIALQLGYRF